MKRDATTAYDPIYASQHGVTVSIDTIGELISHAHFQITLVLTLCSKWQFANSIRICAKTAHNPIELLHKQTETVTLEPGHGCLPFHHVTPFSFFRRSLRRPTRARVFACSPSFLQTSLQ